MEYIQGSINIQGYSEGGNSVNCITDLSIYNQTKTKDTAAIKRPDLYFSSRKKNLDVEIKEVIVPELITKYEIDQLDKTLSDCRLLMVQCLRYILIHT